MPGDSRRYLVTLAILIVAALGVLFVSVGETVLGRGLIGQGYTYVVDIDNWRRTDRERFVQSPYNFSLDGDLNDLPMSIGGWQGRDVPQTNIEAMILLDPEQFVQRLYSRPESGFLWLSLIGSRKSKSFHPPQICYVAAGWSTDASSERIPLEEGDIYALRLLATKPLEDGRQIQHVSLYFYVWADPMRDNSRGLVLFRTTSPVLGDLEKTLATQKEFIRLFFTRAQG